MLRLDIRFFKGEYRIFKPRAKTCERLYLWKFFQHRGSHHPGSLVSQVILILVWVVVALIQTIGPIFIRMDLIKIKLVLDVHQCKPAAGYCEN